jgi:hypothetical protein
MTSPDQLGQQSEEANAPSEEAPEPPLDPRQQSAGRFSLSGNRRGLFWITLSLVALAGLSVAVIDAVSGGTHQPTSSGAPAAAGAASGSTRTGNSGQAPAGSRTAKSTPISAVKLAEQGGALSVPKSLQSRVASWRAGPGGTDLAAVSRGFGDALQAAGIRQYTLMKNACIQLAGSVTTAQAGPQIPDAAMQSLYANALADLAKGAADCRVAITSKPSGEETVETHVNGTMLRLSLSELGAGARNVFRSTAEIEILTRNHQ